MAVQAPAPLAHRVSRRRRAMLADVHPLRRVARGQHARVAARLCAADTRELLTPALLDALSAVAASPQTQADALFDTASSTFRYGLSVSEAAAALGCSATTADRRLGALSMRGLLRCHRPNHDWKRGGAYTLRPAGHAALSGGRVPAQFDDAGRQAAWRTVLAVADGRDVEGVVAAVRALRGSAFVSLSNPPVVDLVVRLADQLNADAAQTSRLLRDLTDATTPRQARRIGGMALAAAVDSDEERAWLTRVGVR